MAITIVQTPNIVNITIERNGDTIDVEVVRNITSQTIQIDRLQGPPGISAYQVAVNNGFVGTEEEWLLSLVAPTVIFSATEPPSPVPGTIWFQI